MSLLLLGCASHPPAEDDYAARSDQMIREVRDMAALAGPRADPIAEDVLAAMRRVKRHRFVPAPLQARAYQNRPLPIAHGQTISQPYIVALMSQLVAARPGTKILEVGTGSGYQAAVLAELGADVYTVEIIPALARTAAETLVREGYDGVHTRPGDGYLGWPEAAPFDGVIVTAAPDHIPPPLIEQLKTGGRLIIPVGPADKTQELVLGVKRPDGTLRTRSVAPVEFVPLTGER